MKELNEDYQRKLESFLWDLQKVIAFSVNADSEMGYEHGEFSDCLWTYARLFSLAESCLKDEYYCRQKSAKRS